MIPQIPPYCSSFTSIFPKAHETASLPGLTQTGNSTPFSDYRL